MTLIITPTGNDTVLDETAGLQNLDQTPSRRGQYQDLIATANEADDGVWFFSAWRPDVSLWQHATPFLRRLRVIGTYKRPTKPLSYRSRSHKAPALAGGGKDLRAYRIYRKREHDHDLDYRNRNA